MKRFLAIMCAVVLFMGITAMAVSQNESDGVRVLTPPLWMNGESHKFEDESLPQEESNEMFSIDRMSSLVETDKGLEFSNYVDGYSIIIPDKMKSDMSMADVCAFFTDGIRTLRIFKESFDTESERESYLSYSNYFLENTLDHKIEVSETSKKGRYTIRTIQWSRKPLKKIKNDKCNYALIDIIYGKRVYTFFFTSSKKFAECGGYADIVESFSSFNPIISAKNAYNRGYKKSDTAHMNETTKANYDRLFGENSDFTMGIFMPEQYGGFEKLENLEKTLDYEFSAELHYSAFVDKHGIDEEKYAEKVERCISGIKKHLEYAKNNGNVLELTLQTPISRETSENMVYEILDGEHDGLLEKYVALIKEYSDVTVLFRPFNEMNSDWCNYSAYHTSRDPQIYVELYKYLYGKFEDAGCDNLIWVWNPNEKSFPRFKWTHEQLYYPGDEYVDVYGITGYNTGTYYPAEIWRTFEAIYQPIYERALRINEKPLMITEFACSATGGDKPEWVEDMFEVLHKFDKIKMAIWWSGADYDGDEVSRPYFIDDPVETLDILKKELKKLK